MSLMRFYVNGSHTHILSLSLSFLVFWWCSFLDGFNKAFNVVFFPMSTKKSSTGFLQLSFFVHQQRRGKKEGQLIVFFDFQRGKKLLQKL